MMLKNEVLCIGSATLDTFLSISGSLKDVNLGDKLLITHVEKHSGGGATNSAAVLSKLGIKTAMLTKLGHDAEAIFIENEMKEYGVKNLCMHRSRKHTDFANIVSGEKDKDRVIYVHKGASLELGVNDFKRGHLNVKWIYLATLMDHSFDTAKEIVKLAKNKKALFLFNPSLYLAEKGKEYLAEVLMQTDLLVLNKEEAKALTNSRFNEAEKLLMKLVSLGAKSVVITNGDKKIYAYHNKQIYSLMPPKVKVIHTAGAGDAFTAGLLAGLIKGYSFGDSLMIGQAEANSIIQHIGTKNKIIEMKEIWHEIRKTGMKVERKKLR